MKFTSPTKRKEYGRCPKRYHYRYLHAPATTAELIEHRRRQWLYGVRELGGLLIHATAARMVRTIAAGDSWNIAKEGADCLREFETIVAKSFAAEPGQWTGEIQLAEIFNGASPADLKDDVNHWRTLIPICIENAWRASVALRLKRATSDYTIETEKQVVWKRGHLTSRFVFDVLVQSEYRTLLIDWKTHEIDNADVDQVRHYLEYMHREKGIPITRLSGFAVDLRREGTVLVPYEPYIHLHSPPFSLAALSSPKRPPTAAAAPYPANPSADLCLRCPYVSLCPASAVTPVRTASAAMLCVSKLNFEL